MLIKVTNSNDNILNGLIKINKDTELPIFKDDVCVIPEIPNVDKDNIIFLSKNLFDSFNYFIDKESFVIGITFQNDNLIDVILSAIFEFKKLRENDLAYIYLIVENTEFVLSKLKGYYDYYNKMKDPLSIKASIDDKNNRVLAFKDTRITYLNNSYLKDSIINSQNKSIIYEDFIELENENKKSSVCNIEFDNARTIMSASKYVKNYHVAVLNFASGTHPGGGVVTGSGAQEESICRVSTLYPVISHQNFYSDFYLYNKSTNGLASNRIIYVKDIVIFKEDYNIPSLPIDSKDWFKLDVITCAAPNLRYANISDFEAYDIFEERIENILKAAIENDIDVIILGAFGCGAFMNNPLVVSRAFKKVIDNYYEYFKKIVFAIPDIDLNYKIFLNEIEG